MRILALAEIADDWGQAVERWAAQNSGFTRLQGGERRATAAHEYMLYQALVGAWPAAGVDESFVKRMQAYAIKAAREGKQQTSWTSPNDEYEAALTSFVGSILDAAKSSDFIADFGALAERAGLLGAVNSLSQLALKTLLPGVPDFFQGSEFWDTSLVDPDNRRAVNYSLRTDHIADKIDWADLVANWKDGRIKFALTRKLLQIRNQHSRLFSEGAYRPISSSGPHADQVIGFSRSHERTDIMVLVGRRMSSVSDGGRQWPRFQQGSTVDSSAAGAWNLLHGGSLAALDISQLFAMLPVAVVRLDR
jgi:(1->4)-alpha-D-glucan 1-alpha-D-glucosylmutase